VIAVDTNVLIAAHREDHEFHGAARQALQALAGSGQAWSVPWPCVHEFLRIVTGGAFRQPTPVEVALAAVEAWFSTGRSQAVPLGEGAMHLDLLRRLALEGKIRGAAIHDARIAAICIAHGVRELWSADRDFSRFPELKIRNPLIQPG
jgi:toxin-antitoxin system PIN domain toxin